MSVAKSYARALYETLQEHKVDAQAVDTLEAQLEAFSDSVGKSREAKMAFYGPITSSKEKVALVQSISKSMSKESAMSSILAQFIELLARKGRMALLPELCVVFHEVRLAAEGGMLGQVISAEPMDAKDVEGLAQSFSKKLGKKVAFKVSVDVALLAGMKVVVNGVTYDGTLRAQLQKLKEQVSLGATEGHA
jgi:F-type H+-transporting ATPase subunit delta